MFWISFWLSSELHFADADASLLSSWYDIGAITGGVLIGLSDGRVVVIVPSAYEPGLG